jgi:tetratricopeptide (TPR) repeat protein
VDFFEPKNQHFCDFRIDVSLKKGETTVFQYAKDFPFYFPPDREDYIQNNGLSIQDSLPVIEGEYRLTILLQNSVGKEFSIYEADISIPQDTGPPRISGLTTGYKLQSAAGAARVPFQALDQQIFTDPNDTLGLQDQAAFLVGLANIPENLWKTGEVIATIRGSKDKEAVRKSLTIKLVSVPFSARLNLAQALPARELAPDYYEIGLSLKDASGALLDTKTSHFFLSPAEAVPHPVTLAKSFPLSNVFLYYHTLAVQYDRAGDVRQAEENFEKALALKPDYFGGAADYAGFLVKIQKFDKALDIVERLKGNEKLKFDYFLMRGRALMGKERYGEAIESLLEGNKVYNSDIRLLNALGFCFYKTRQRQEALDVLNASLRLNPNQKDVKELLAKIEKDLK